MAETNIVTPDAARAGIVASLRRKFIVFAVLAFVAGVIAGCLLGIYVLRYHFFNHPPPPGKIAQERAKRIQKDLGLNDETGQKIYQENLRHFEEVQGEFASRHEWMENSLKRYAANIATLIDDPALKTRWLASYRNYFPKGPPPPPPPPKD